jgi:hypothetical protein
VAHTLDSVPKHAAARGQWLRDTRALAHADTRLQATRPESHPLRQRSLACGELSFASQRAEPREGCPLF